MKFKSKKHLMLTLKKKSGATLSTEEAKELETLNAEAKKEEPKKEEDKKEEKKEEPKKEEEEKKPEPEKKAEGGMSLDALGEAVAKLSENVNMVMEALAALMEQGAAPAEESKEDPKKDEEQKEDEAKKDEEQKSDDEESEDEEKMLDELEKTIAELEALEE